MSKAAFGAARQQPIVEVVDTFMALMRAFGRTKARFMAAQQDDVEWSAQYLLRQLAKQGPMRASAIADYLQSDPSTVSRQVAALVRDGFVERRADADDGRASILVLTAKADAALAEHEDNRLQLFTELLDGWNDRELSQFAVLLRRFTDDFEKSSDNVISERVASRHRAAEGKL